MNKHLSLDFPWPLYPLYTLHKLMPVHQQRELLVSHFTLSKTQFGFSCYLKNIPVVCFQQKRTLLVFEHNW